MSALNSFRILSKKDNTITVEVKIVHPDEHYMHAKPNFALQIITELYDNIQKGYIYNSGYEYYPFTKEEAKNYLLPDKKQFFDNLLEIQYGRKIPISEKEYKERQKTKNYTYKGQNVGMSGGGNAYFLNLETEWKLFCEEAEKYIQNVQITHLENYPHWADSFDTWLEYQHKFEYEIPEEAFDEHEFIAPRYILGISVFSEYNFLLHHVLEGCSWESAIYNFESYAKEYLPKYTNVPKILLYDTQNTPNLENDFLENWWENLDKNWQNIFQKNLFLQTNVLPIYIVNDYSGMMLSVFESRFPNKTFEKPTLHDLQNMSKMQAIFASGCDLNDLSPLKICQNLKILELEANNITDILVLENLTSLQYLNIYSNKISDTKALKSLKNLRYLFFDPLLKQNLEDITNLKNLRTLHFLSESEEIFDAHFLENLPNLRKVSAWSPAISKESYAIIEKLTENDIDIIWDTEQEN